MRSPLARLGRASHAAPPARLTRACGAGSRPINCATRMRSSCCAKGVPLNVIQRRNPGVTSIYLQGIDPDEIIETAHARRPPMIPASAGQHLPSAR
jgi:hypothetical protein